MEGTLVVQEERGTINKFRNWYKEKIIDTGKSQNFEKTIDKNIDKFMKIECGKDNVVKIILPFIPYGNLVAPLIPTFQKIKGGIANIYKNSIIKSKRFIEAKFIGVNGENKEVILPSFNTEQLGNDIKESIRDVTTVVETIEESEQIGKSL